MYGLYSHVLTTSPEIPLELQVRAPYGSFEAQVKDVIGSSFEEYVSEMGRAPGGYEEWKRCCKKFVGRYVLDITVSVTPSASVTVTDNTRNRCPHVIGDADCARRNDITECLDFSLPERHCTAGYCRKHVSSLMAWKVFEFLHKVYEGPEFASLNVLLYCPRRFRMVLGDELSAWEQPN